jgi:hypothetical protein
MIFFSYKTFVRLFKDIPFLITNVVLSIEVVFNVEKNKKIKNPIINKLDRIVFVLLLIMSDNKDKINFQWPYKRKNYVLFGIGVFVIILGYLIMYLGEVNSFQSLTLSPILLLIGYLIIIPYALLHRNN